MSRCQSLVIRGIGGDSVAQKVLDKLNVRRSCSVFSGSLVNQRVAIFIDLHKLPLDHFKVIIRVWDIYLFRI